MESAIISAVHTSNYQPQHTPNVTVIFSNMLGHTMRIVAESFNQAYSTAITAEFDVYDWEIEEGEDFCAA